MVCPACDKGTVGSDRRCDKCGIGVPRGTEAPFELTPVKRKRRVIRQTQELWETDYSRTKEDKL